jgi:hypothetical protein
LEIVTLSNFKMVYSGQKCDYLRTYREVENKHKVTNKRKNKYKMEEGPSDSLVKSKVTKTYKDKDIANNFAMIEPSNDQEDGNKFFVYEDKDY